MSRYGDTADDALREAMRIAREAEQYAKRRHRRLSQRQVDQLVSEAEARPTLPCERCRRNEATCRVRFNKASKLTLDKRVCLPCARRIYKETK